MSTAEKRKRLYGMMRRNNQSEASIEKLGEMDDATLDAQLGSFSRKTGATGGIDSEARDLLKPRDTSTPFSATSGPFERMGAILGQATSAITGALTTSVNAFADPERARDEMRVRPSVSFMGLQDLQRSVQQSIGEDESRRDKLKLEQGKKQVIAAEATADRLKEMPGKLASEFARLVGLQ